MKNILKLITVFSFISCGAFAGAPQPTCPLGQVYQNGLCAGDGAVERPKDNAKDSNNIKNQDNNPKGFVGGVTNPNAKK